MQILATGAQSAQPDYIALAMVLALFVLVAVMALRKRYAKPAAAPAPAEVPAEVTPVPDASNAPTAPGSAGQLKLHDVPPKTAAMLMAIVADKTGKPLNELRFISIKEVQ